jgi:Flp pilus assembly protein TadB
VVRSARPMRITDAAPSQAEQLRYREVRYVLMMGVRALCLIMVVVLVSLHVPLLWLWVPILAIGMVVIPWLAVILANDRAPKSRYRVPQRPEMPQRALTADPGEEPRHIIDIDS